ncbi:MAG: hypothetical protein ACPGUD_07550 [Parashewanella sp.]
MLITWSESRQKITDCVDLTKHPRPINCEIPFIIRSAHTGMVLRQVTYRVKQVSNSTPLAYTVEPSNVFLKFYRFLVQDPLQTELAQQFNNAETKRSPDVVSTSLSTAFPALTHYSVSGDGACMFRCILAIYYRDVRWLSMTYFSKAEVARQLNQEGFKPYIIDAINRSFEHAVEYSGGLSNKLQMYFTEHPSFVEDVYNNTIANGSFSYYHSRGIKNALVGFPTTEVNVTWENNFFGTWGDSCAELITNNLQVCTNSASDQYLSELKQPILLRKPPLHYELLASESYFTGEKSAEVSNVELRPTTARHFIAADPTSFFRAIVAFKSKELVWLSLGERSQKQLHQKLVTLGIIDEFKTHLLTSFQDACSTQSETLKPKKDIPELFHVVEQNFPLIWARDLTALEMPLLAFFEETIGAGNFTDFTAKVLCEKMLASYCASDQMMKDQKPGVYLTHYDEVASDDAALDERVLLSESSKSKADDAKAILKKQIKEWRELYKRQDLQIMPSKQEINHFDVMLHSAKNILCKKIGIPLSLSEGDNYLSGNGHHYYLITTEDYFSSVSNATDYNSLRL